MIVSALSILALLAVLATIYQADQNLKRASQALETFEWDREVAKMLWPVKQSNDATGLP